MTTLTDEEWKDILTAAFEGETSPRISPGLEGGMVMLGRRTSRYGKKRFSEWLDWLNAASHHAGIKIPAPKNVVEFSAGLENSTPNYRSSFPDRAEA